MRLERPTPEPPPVTCTRVPGLFFMNSSAQRCTASRFASAPSDLPVTAAQRRELLGRLGVFGVWLSVSLIRSGVATNASALARELLARSGLSRLTEVLEAQFVNRAQVLKAAAGI